MSILTRVQANPMIGTDNAAYVADLVERAKLFILQYCNLPIFPEKAKGYSQGETGAATSITTILSDSVYVSVNGSGQRIVTLDLPACTTGTLTAAELQSKIRDVGNDVYGFDEVTVTFNAGDTSYRITSGRYGEDSAVCISFNADEKHIAQALKLSPVYGGVEYRGAFDNLSLQSVAVALVEAKYRELGLEGLKSGSIPGGVSFSKHDLDPQLESMLIAHRRL